MRNYLYLVILLTTVSCNKYLDKKSDQSFLIPKELKDLVLLVDNNDVFNFATTPDVVGSTDEVSIDSVQYRLLAGYQLKEYAYLWKLKEHTDYKYGQSNSWMRPYEAIYYANLCLDKISKISKTPANQRDWNRVNGSALFFRAYYLAQLSWAFSKNYDENNNTDLGVVIKLKNDFNVPSVRSTVKECYTQIIQDAKASLDYLEMGSSTQAKPNKKAAYALLSRVYMSMLKYDSAFHYADLLLKNYQPLTDFNNPAEVNVDAFYPIRDFCSEIIFLSSAVNTALTFSQSTVDTAFYHSYASNDLRRRAYFQTLSNQFYTYQVYKTFVFMEGGMFTGFATGEMYLNRAECYARKNKLDEALADINLLRSKRYETATHSPVTTHNQQELLEIILEERKKELACRGTRWMDIKRLNKEFNNITIKHYNYTEGKYYTLPPNDNRYALPLPLDIVQITGMPQN